MQDELLKQAREADREDKHAAELFEVMVKTEAWQVYSAMLTRKIEAQGAIVLEPAAGVDRAVALEYEKGTMRGLLIAQGLPQHTIQATKQLSDPDTDT